MKKLWAEPSRDGVPHEIESTGEVYYVPAYIVCELCTHPLWLREFPIINLRMAMTIMAIEATYPERYAWS